MEYQNFASLSVNLNRQKYGPLDISSVFNNSIDLDYYISQGQIDNIEEVSEYWRNVVPYPYEGQIVSLVENGEVSVFKLVKINDHFEAISIGSGDDIEINVDDALDETSINPVQNKVITSEIQALKAEIGYEPIKITNFTHNGLNVEYGNTYMPNTIQLQWESNKTPVSGTINNLPLTSEELESCQASRSPGEMTMYNPAQWTLKLVDDLGNSDEQTIGINFFNGVYYGIINNAETITNEMILNAVKNTTLTKQITNNINLEFTGIANKANTTEQIPGQVFLFACPSQYVTNLNIKFIDAETNLPAGMELKRSDFSFVNIHDYSEKYNMWLSKYEGLGKMTIIIKTEVKEET